MGSVTASPGRSKVSSRKPLLAVSVVGRLIGGASAEDLLIGAAVLEIEDGRELTSYWLQANTDERGHVVGWKLKKFNSSGIYDLPASLDSCDCPDGIYCSERPGGCRHQQAIRQALASNVVPAPRRPDRKTERDEATMADIFGQ